MSAMKAARCKYGTARGGRRAVQGGWLWGDVATVRRGSESRAAAAGLVVVVEGGGGSWGAEQQER